MAQVWQAATDSDHEGEVVELEYACPSCDEDLHRLYKKCFKGCRCPCHEEER